MVADIDSGSGPALDAQGSPAPSTPGPQPAPKRDGAGPWAALAVVLLAAVVVVFGLTQCVPRVPNVTGLTRAEAESRLASAGYKTGAISFVIKRGAARGSVAEQAPEADTVLAKGGSVDLLVTRGADLVTVPDVVGNDTAVAAKTIGSTGLGLKATSQNSDTIPQGAVIAQLPSPGTKVPSNSSVTLVVSLGPLAVANGAGISGSSGGTVSSSQNGGTGSATSPTPSQFVARYPNAVVFSSGGDIYIRLTPGASARRITSGSAWDTNPILSPSAQYVVFMRAPKKGKLPNQLGMVNLTSFVVAMLDVPGSPFPPNGVFYSSMRFAPAPNGTTPDSDWLVSGQSMYGDPDSAPSPGARVLVTNVPIDSSWVSWNNSLRSNGSGIKVTGSTVPGCLRVTSGQTSYNFDAYSGMYTN